MEKANLIKQIGDTIIDRLEELDKEYEIDYDEGYFDHASYNVSLCFDYGNTSCDIDAGVYWHSNRSADIEVFLEAGFSDCGKQKKLDRLQEAVQRYVFDNLDTDAMLSMMEEELADASMDEWERHGFRDAADYYHYRYG